MKWKNKIFLKEELYSIGDPVYESEFDRACVVKIGKQLFRFGKVGEDDSGRSLYKFIRKAKYKK